MDDRGEIGDGPAALRQWARTADREIALLRQEVDELKKWRSFVLGAAAIVVLVIGVLADTIRRVVFGGP